MELTREKAMHLRAAMDAAGNYLTDDQAASVPDIYRPWITGMRYMVGDRRLYNNILYKCLQEHTAQDDWTPDAAHSLWARILIPDPTVIPVWEQPDSTNPYMAGDKVHFPGAEDPVYESTVDNNVWAPNVYGWQIVQD